MAEDVFVRIEVRQAQLRAMFDRVREQLLELHDRVTERHQLRMRRRATSPLATSRRQATRRPRA